MMRTTNSRTRLFAATLLAALPAYASVPAQAQDAATSEHSVAVNGATRSYLVHIPPTVGRPAPVVLIFHGGGGRPEGMMRKTGMNDLADRYGFIAVYPEGAPAPSGRGGTWNVGISTSPSSADDVAFVRAILAELDRVAPLDHTRIYATGLSMGGVFAYRLACELSDTFAAIAPVSATMVEPSCQPRSPVAVLHIHGRADERIPLDGGRGEMTAGNRSWPAPARGVASWARFDGCAAGPSKRADGPATCDTYASCRATVEYCVIAGQRHGWPGESTGASEDSTMDGDRGGSFPASERIWRFFAAHAKQPR